MNLSDLRKELSARNLNLKGIKSQLAARLGKYLKTEAEDECEGAEKASKLLQAAQDIDLAEKEIKGDNLKVCILNFNILQAPIRIINGSNFGISVSSNWYAPRQRSL